MANQSLCLKAQNYFSVFYLQGKVFYFAEKLNCLKGKSYNIQ
jgi:hypothetical protein